MRMTSPPSPRAAAEAVRARSDVRPLVGVVLGSGLGAFGDTLGEKLPYAEIPGMPASSVVGHAGNLCLGRIGAVEVACLQGRVHLYEGHDPSAVVFGVRTLAALGCRAVLVTNAAGGIDPSFAPGDLMLVTDHLNLTGRNVLVGPNDASVGPRFPDMTEAYDRALGARAREAAAEVGVALREGTYAGLLGPTYETPAEVRMLRALGAHAVGMSTVQEVIALRHGGVRVAAISCITNLAAGISPTPLDHAEVEAVAQRTRGTFVRLLARWIEGAGREVSS
jgi:purine-nucleoside phosphorylase